MTLEKLLIANGFEILGNKDIFKKEQSEEMIKQYSSMLEKLKRATNSDLKTAKII